MSRTFKYEVPDNIPEEDISRALDQLPSWRLEQALSYKRPLDRFLSAKAYLLLRDALEKVYGLRGDVSFAYGPHGKPFLKEHPEIHFNLSHCRKCVCCILSSAPVGIDVEGIQYDADISQVAFSASEREAILRAERKDVAFTRLWTMKESMLKLSGEGLSDDLKGLLDKDTPSFSLDINLEKGYVLCTAEKDR